MAEPSLSIDPSDPLPVYAQIERGMSLLVAGGHWAPEGQVPSVRELAVRLRVNPLTVQKAYRLLIEQGVLVSRPGAGVFVAKRQPASAEPRGMAEEVLAEAVEKARTLGLRDDEIHRIVEGSLHLTRR